MTFHANSKMQPSRSSQTGIALIAILIIVATVAALATQMHWQHRLSMKRIENISIGQQARQYALGGENWVREILTTDLQDSNSDHLQEIWATPLPPLPIDGGAIQGKIVDLQARFNLNNLILPNGSIDPDSLKQFTLLLQNLDIEPEIAQAVADWLDTDNYPEFPGGAEDSVYSSLRNPFLTANHYITDTSELLSIKGINKTIYKQLLPHISILPLGSAININTASPEVLLTIDNSLSKADIDNVISSRELSPFEDVSDFYTLANLNQQSVSTLLSTQSEYFVTEVEVFLHERVYRRHTYLYRDISGTGNVSIYQRIHNSDPLPELVSD